MVTAIRLSAVVGDDHKLVIDVPHELPPGPVELLIRPTQSTTAPSVPLNPAREAARAKLLAAGALVTEFDIPDDARPLTREERRRIGTLPPGARSSEDLVNEDRGEY